MPTVKPDVWEGSLRYTYSLRWGSDGLLATVDDNVFDGPLGSGWLPTVG